MTYRITAPAERDIKSILAETLKVFGTLQLAVYVAIIDRALAMVGEEPDRPGSIDRSEIRPGVRLFHLGLAAGRRGAAAHCIYYATGRMTDGSMGAIVLRILQEGMEPRHKILPTKAKSRRS
jgi:toxin ParE1/3/4